MQIHKKFVAVVGKGSIFLYIFFFFTAKCMENEHKRCGEKELKSQQYIRAARGSGEWEEEREHEEQGKEKKEKKDGVLYPTFRGKEHY